MTGSEVHKDEVSVCRRPELTRMVRIFQAEWGIVSLTCKWRPRT